MGRSPLRDGGESSESDGGGVKKGPWTPEEDQKLIEYVEKHGRGSWQRIPKLAGLNRCGKSCRLRWTNYLRPDIKRGKFTEEEEQHIIQLHSLVGNKWSSIATKLPGRTDNEIKNYWNTHLRKKLLRMGIDPVTHRPTAATTNLGVLAGLSALLAPGNAVAMDNALKLVQADVAHLLKLQLVQNLFQVLTTTTTTTTTSSSSSSSAAAAAVDLMNLFGSPSLGSLPSSLPSSNLAILSQFLSSTGGLLQQPMLMESSFSMEEEADVSRTTEEAASMEISNGSAASNSTPNLVSPNSSDCITKNSIDLLKSTHKNNNNNNTFAENNNDNINSIDSNLASSSSHDAWDNLKLDDLDSDFGWKEIIEEMTWPDA